MKRRPESKGRYVEPGLAGNAAGELRRIENGALAAARMGFGAGIRFKTARGAATRRHRGLAFRCAGGSAPHRSIRATSIFSNRRFQIRCHESEAYDILGECLAPAAADRAGGPEIVFR